MAYRLPTSVEGSSRARSVEEDTSDDSGIEEWAQHPPPDDPHVHVGVFCDGCLAKGKTTFMEGARWKCVQCPSWDLCQTCYDELQAYHTRQHRPQQIAFSHPTDHTFIVYTATYEQTPGWVENASLDEARVQYYRSRLPLSPVLPQDEWKFDKKHPNRVEPNLYFDFWLVDIANIDEARHTVDIDIWIYCQWTPALPELRIANPSGEIEILQFPKSHAELMAFWDEHIHAPIQRSHIFFPQLHMIGPHGLEPVYNPVRNPRLTYSDGLSEDLHFRGPVRYSPQLAWYPFDTQVVVLTFTVPASCDRLLLTTPLEVFVSRAARAASSGMRGWRLKESRLKRLFHSYAILGEFPRDEISISQMSDYTSSIELQLHFTRRWAYQILLVVKICVLMLTFPRQKVVPLDLIVFAGWIVFLIPESDSEDTGVQISRLTVGVTVLLALAAFNVSLNSNSPNTASPTLMDLHAVWSFFLATLTTLASLDVPRTLWLPLIHAGVSRGLVTGILFVFEHLLVATIVVAKKTGYLGWSLRRMKLTGEYVLRLFNTLRERFPRSKSRSLSDAEKQEMPAMILHSARESVVGLSSRSAHRQHTSEVKIEV